MNDAEYDACAFNLTVEKVEEETTHCDATMPNHKLKLDNRYDVLRNDTESHDDDAVEKHIGSSHYAFPRLCAHPHSKRNKKKMPIVSKAKWVRFEEAEERPGESEASTTPARAVRILTKESDQEERIDALDHKSNDGWSKVRGTVDSGAAEHVANRDHFPQFEVMPPKKGIRYVTANGERIPHAGAQRVRMATNEGGKRTIDFQLSEVDKPLLGANKICRNGHYIVLDENEGWIVNKKTNECTRLEVEDGTYKIDMWIRGFQRQAS